MSGSNDRTPKQPEVIVDGDGARFFFHAPDDAHRAPTIIEVMQALGSVLSIFSHYELDWVEFDREGITLDFANPNSNL